jgi:hypothetical protein
LEKVNLDGGLDGHEYQNIATDFTACAHSSADVSHNCCITRLHQNRKELSQELHTGEYKFFTAKGQSLSNSVNINQHVSGTRIKVSMNVKLF